MKRLWIALGVIALDQGSKFLAVRYLAPSGPVTLIPGVLGLRYAENTGMAFSMFAGRSWLLGLCSLGLLVLAWLFLRRYELGKVAGAAAMLMLGGAVGNLVDRFFYRLRGGYVRGAAVPLCHIQRGGCGADPGSGAAGDYHTMDAQGMEREKAWRYNRGSGMKPWETARAGRTCCWRLPRG